MMDKEQLFDWALSGEQYRFADEDKELREERTYCFTTIDAAIDYLREKEVVSLRTMAEVLLYYGLLGIARTDTKGGAEPPPLIEGGSEAVVEHFKEAVMEVLPDMLQQVVYSLRSYPKGEMEQAH